MPNDVSDRGEGPLQWRTEGPYQLASDGGRLYVRETGESVIASTLFGMVLMVGAGFLGWRLVQPAQSGGTRAFGAALLLAAAALAGVAVWQVLGALGVTRAQTRGPLVVFDRGASPAGGGGGGGGGEVRFAGRAVSASRIRCFSTRPAEGGRAHDLLRHIVVAELHDGGLEVLGLAGTSNWPAHYAHHAAVWMALPYRPHES